MLIEQIILSNALGEPELITQVGFVDHTDLYFDLEKYVIRLNSPIRGAITLPIGKFITQCEGNYRRDTPIY